MPEMNTSLKNNHNKNWQQNNATKCYRNLDTAKASNNKPPQQLNKQKMDRTAKEIRPWSLPQIDER